MIMRDRMERLVILPFSVGCMSEASVAVGVQQPSKSRPFTSSTKGCKGGPEEECESEEGGSSASKVHVSKSNMSTGLNKLMKGFKNLSQLFGDQKEDHELEEEEEEEEEGEGEGEGEGEEAGAEREMQIGGPTDVQHVTHIGWDGHAITANPGVPMRAWDLLSLSLSLHHQ